MSFLELSEEQEMLIRTISRLAKEKLAPMDEEMEKKGVFPNEVWELFKENGILGIPFPEEYDGSGMGILSYCMAVEELAKFNNNAASMLVGQFLGSTPIIFAGNEEQKRKYLPHIVSGEYIVAFGMTEPGAGSDVGSMTSTAVRDGDHYVLNGRKCFISNGDIAKIICVFAKTDQKAGHNGVSGFILDTATPGFSVGKTEDKMSGKPIHACELIFEDVRIPKENLLGKEGEGFKIAMQVLDRARPGIAARAVGLAQGSLDYAVDYIKQRVQFGQPIAKNQGIQWMVADMATEIEAARLLYYRACQEIENNGHEIGKYGAMAKYYSTDMAMKVTTDAVQLLGGYGFMEDYPLARRMRDAKLAQIIEGTNQIQRIVVGRSVIGKI
ncbi:MAG: acyl-CoA dehydrogenase family protein [Carboxydocellales bacterium]